LALSGPAWIVVDELNRRFAVTDGTDRGDLGE
jgi:hypothetical protein